MTSNEQYHISIFVGESTEPNIEREESLMTTIAAVGAWIHVDGMSRYVEDILALKPEGAVSYPIRGTSGGTIWIERLV